MTHIIAQPFVDIRRKRSKRRLKVRKDVFQESQGIMGDSVRILGVKESWAYIENESQPKFVGEAWEGVRGWIEESSLAEEKEEEKEKHPKDYLIVSAHYSSVHDEKGNEIVKLCYGTKVSLVDEAEEGILVRIPDGRQGIVQKSTVSLVSNDKVLGDALVLEARKFIGVPYFWGGCSSFPLNDEDTFGMDCSGFIYLIHRALGKEIPRDAKDQFKKANPQDTLETGDLIFYSTPEDPEKMIHVILYAGNGMLIEATECVGKVRELPFSELFDGDIAHVKSGEALIRKDIEQKRNLYFASFCR